MECGGIEPPYSACRADVIPLYEHPGVEIRRIELRLRQCHCRVIPLDHIPAKGQSGNRTGHRPAMDGWMVLPRYRRGVLPEHLKAIGDTRVERDVLSL